jgi:hypothetical protein
MLQGWSLRATLAGPAGFPGDPANDDFNGGGAAGLSGTSSNGIPWTWSTTNVGSRDRSGSVDPRLAGIVLIAPTDPAAIFTATLPSSGTFDITLALGDQSAQQCINFDILDNGSLLFNVATNVLTGGPNNYLDATGVNRTSDTDWVANNVKKRLTFTTTSAGFRLNAPSSASSVWAHLFIESVGGGSPATPSIFIDCSW